MKHKFTKNNNYFTISVYAFVTILLAAFGIKIIYNFEETKSIVEGFFSVIGPFLAGLLIAYMINPLSEFLSRKVFKPIFRISSVKIRKIVSVILSYVIIIGIIVALMFYIVPQVVDSLSQINNFISTAQTGYNKVMTWLRNFEEAHPSWDLQPVYDLVKSIPEKVSDFITTSLPELLPAIFSTSVSVITAFFDGIIAIFVSIYMLMDKPYLINNAKKFVYSALGSDKGDKVIATAGECNKIFGEYIIGKTIDAILVGVLCWIFMTILEIPYPLVISLIVGISNMIPYFGPIIGAVPGIILLLIVDIPYAIVFGIMILVIQQIDAWYLEPRILGETTGIRPIWIIFAITVGGYVAGVLGMFLGVPVVAVLSFLLDKLIATRIVKKDIVFETDPETGIITRSGMIIDDTEYQPKNEEE